MEITCISCNSMFYLDNSRVNSAGSLIRCTKCHFIFMIYQPDFIAERVVEDTNIDQSILLDLFNMQHVRKTKLPVDEISEESDDYEVESLMSIEDYDEEVEDQKVNSDIDDYKYADLPDLSVYENMIDWGDNKDLGKPFDTK